MAAVAVLICRLGSMRMDSFARDDAAPLGSKPLQSAPVSALKPL